jgi:hypothetical protein
MSEQLKAFFTRVRPYLRPALTAAGATVLFLAVWAFLNANFNVRYPAREHEPKYWYLLPSIDVVVILALLAAAGALKISLRSWLIGPLAFLVVFVRLYRIADGLIEQNWFRNVNLYMDLPLLPELARLLRSTVPFPKLILGALAVALLFALFCLAIFGSLYFAQRYLATSWFRRGVFLAVVMVTYALGAPWPDDESPKLHKGLFGKSIEPVLAEQMKFIASAKLLRQAKSRQIQDVEAHLARIPADMKALKGADVLFLLVESYGASVFHNAYLNSGVGPMLEHFGADLSDHGWYAASNFLVSPTYGGGSWMAHATLNTGVRVGDGLEYAVILHASPPPRTMGQIFKEAGYRSVLVQPGTTRPFPEGMSFGFEKKYYAWQLEYQGPPFGWAEMPDEYVLDYIQRKELDAPRGPVFLEYAMVSSHAPWSVVPLAVNDWSKIGHGQLFKDYQAKFPISWSNLRDGAPAYCYSLYYDFDLIKRFLLERVKRNSFVIIMGDHQPAAVITGNDPSWTVPIHVLSKDRSLIERFNNAGYTSGMFPPSTGGSIPGLETLLPELMQQFSEKPAPDR